MFSRNRNSIIKTSIVLNLINMKKYHFLILSLLFINCSSSDDNNKNLDNNLISPPNWIQGNWYYDLNTTNGGFRFTQDNFCLLLTASNSCFKEQVENMIEIGQNATINETKNSEEYKIIINDGLGNSYTYHFRKIDNNTIEHLNDPLGNSVVTLLYKN